MPQRHNNCIPILEGFHSCVGPPKIRYIAPGQARGNERTAGRDSCSGGTSALYYVVFLQMDGVIVRSGGVRREKGDEDYNQIAIANVGRRQEGSECAHLLPLTDLLIVLLLGSFPRAPENRDGSGIVLDRVP